MTLEYAKFWIKLHSNQINKQSFPGRNRITLSVCLLSHSKKKKFIYTMDLVWFVFEVIVVYLAQAWHKIQGKGKQQNVYNTYISPTSDSWFQAVNFSSVIQFLFTTPYKFSTVEYADMALQAIQTECKWQYQKWNYKNWLATILKTSNRIDSCLREEGRRIEHTSCSLYE